MKPKPPVKTFTSKGREVKVWKPCPVQLEDLYGWLFTDFGDDHE